MATYLGKAPARLAIVTDDSVTSAKIVDNTVTSADILNASITGADLATDIAITTSGNISTTGDLTVDTNTLYVDSTNNRVGIGTTNPTQDLHILNANGSNVILRDTADRTLVMCGPATGVSPRIGTTGTGSPLIVTLNGNDCFAFTSAGCLGVNTSNPFFGIHICNGTIGFDDGTAIRHGIKSIGHQVGIGRCTLE